MNHLLLLSKGGPIDPWLQFFFEALRQQAQEAVAKIETIIEIRNRMHDVLKTAKARGVVLEIVDDLIAYPVITSPQAARLHGVTYPAANSAIQRLVDLGFLTEITGSNYGKMYICQEIMAAVEGTTARP